MGGVTVRSHGFNPLGGSAIFGNPTARGGTGAGFYEPGIEPVMAPWELYYAAQKLIPAGAAATRVAITPAARIAVRTRAGQALFRSGCWLNRGQNLRIGLDRRGGNEVFHISGEWLETRLARMLRVRNGHIDIFDFGRIGRYR